MNNIYRPAIIVTVFICLFSISGYAKVDYSVPPDSGGTRGPDLWAFDILNIIHHKAQEGRVIKVAVIDNGFRLTHKALKDFIYTNEKEIPGNFQDDDQDGFVDDMHGWDISDNDDDVSVPKGKNDILYHGTYIAGIITSVFQRCYGSDASRYLKIIPIKVLSDQAKNTFYADGYKGIKYACDMGADIICCAWSGGVISADEKEYIDKVIRKGTIIIGASGNFNSEKAELPSSLPGVVCVAALDSLLKKSKNSNYGMRIDISAPGVSLYGPFSEADNSFTYDKGTSAATALITGCVAILKTISPSASSDDILDALKNSARPVDSMNMTYCGKMGAGIPDMKKAMELVADPEKKFASFNSSLPEGKIFYQKKISPSTWEIHPKGAFRGIHIYPSSPDYKGDIKIFNSDSAFYSGPVTGISRGLYIPGSTFRIELQPKSGLPKNMEFSYYMETIDSTTLYCKGIQKLDEERGTIADNSGDENYANNCSCKWQLTVPEGKRIKIEFEEMDTQPNVDFVWFFDGTSTLPENNIARFSGSNKPPTIISMTNQVLVWFLTDATSTGKGWKFRYEPID